MRILHYVDRWLSLSAGFVHAQVSRSAFESTVVSRDPLVHRSTFPHRPVISIGVVGSLRADRAIRVGRTAALSAIAIARRTELVHVHFGYAVHDVLGLVRRRRLPLVLSLHGDDVTALPIDRPHHYDAVVGAVDAVVVPSRFLATRCEALGFDPERLRVIPSGVDTTWFTPTPPATGPPTVAFVGRLVDKKGLDVLLAAWPAVRSEVPDARLRVLGDGPRRDLLEPALAGVERVRPDPSRRHEQVRDLLRSATVVASPSCTDDRGDAESLLLVNLEAQASARPVVTTQHGGIPEFVDPGASALVVPERDADALAAALVAVLTDQDLAVRLGEGGPAVAARFDVSRGAAAVDDVYRSVSPRRR